MEIRRVVACGLAVALSVASAVGTAGAAVSEEGDTSSGVELSDAAFDHYAGQTLQAVLVATESVAPADITAVEWAIAPDDTTTTTHVVRGGWSGSQLVAHVEDASGRFVAAATLEIFHPRGTPTPMSVITLSLSRARLPYMRAYRSAVTMWSDSDRDGSRDGAEVDRLPNTGFGTTTVLPRLGYGLAAADGGVFTFGDVSFHGSMGGTRLNSPVVAIAATTTGEGYWLTAADGGVFTFGDARFFGSLGAVRLNAPIVDVVAFGDDGYWLVGADGGVFAFGDAPFLGSVATRRLPAPIVAMGSYGTNLFGADGSVFVLEGGMFAGSAAGERRRVVAGEDSTSGGYWLAADDGLVRTFNAAMPSGEWAENGSTYAAVGGRRPLAAPITGMSCQGFSMCWLAAADGGVFTWAEAPFFGSMGGTRLTAPVVSMTGRTPI